MTDNTSDETLVQKLIEKANNGDPSAQSSLGCKYTNAEGVTKDDHEAAQWFRLEVDQGHLEARIAIQQIQNDLKLMKRQFTVESRET